MLLKTIEFCDKDLVQADPPPLQSCGPRPHFYICFTLPLLYLYIFDLKSEFIYPHLETLTLEKFPWKMLHNSGLKSMKSVQCAQLILDICRTSGRPLENGDCRDCLYPESEKRPDNLSLVSEVTWCLDCCWHCQWSDLMSVLLLTLSVKWLDVCCSWQWVMVDNTFRQWELFTSVSVDTWCQ